MHLTEELLYCVARRQSHHDGHIGERRLRQLLNIRYGHVPTRKERQEHHRLRKHPGLLPPCQVIKNKRQPIAVGMDSTSTLNTTHTVKSKHRTSYGGYNRKTGSWPIPGLGHCVKQIERTTYAV
ncbi:hypothetical protein LY78DRAFT_444825 [Colletotrichum sublineola]|nr:hypothetical protein LY78DRAFT_444825 [Colletotrichum sublineola]